MKLKKELKLSLKLSALELAVSVNTDNQSSESIVEVADSFYKFIIEED